MGQTLLQRVGADAEPRVAFPWTSVSVFICVAILLRIAAVLAWGFFPPHGILPSLARVLIPLLVVLGLGFLNVRMLRRDGHASGVLGLEFRNFGWFVIGGLTMTAIILLIGGALRLLVPFGWTRSDYTLQQLGWQSAEFFAGNFGEELAFRGYLLLTLIRSFGLNKGLLVSAFLFGIFHLPGLSGIAALKMICSTGACAYLFAYGYLLTGSLWGAVGMHVIGNIVLHNVLGLSGGASSIWTLKLKGAWPESYDPGFVAMGGVCAALAVAGHQLLRREERRVSIG